MSKQQNTYRNTLIKLCLLVFGGALLLDGVVLNQIFQLPVLLIGIAGGIAAVITFLIAVFLLLATPISIA